jgi:aryl-alcohol dehydrogenase-like predicted oxidoreductase
MIVSDLPEKSPRGSVQAEGVPGWLPAGFAVQFRAEVLVPSRNGNSRRWIIREAENSLPRLGIDWIDGRCRAVPGHPSNHWCS